MLEAVLYAAETLVEDDAVEIDFLILKKIGRSEGDRGHNGHLNVRGIVVILERKTLVKMSGT